MLDAAQNGNLQQVQSLLDSGFNPNTANPHGVTGLLRAVMFNHAEIAKLLISRGARITTAHGLPTLLGLAAQKGNMEIATLLLAQGAPVDERDNMGVTALFKAAYSGQLEMAKFLLSKGADRNIKNAYGNTPADAARDEKHPDIAALLNS